MNRAQVQEAVRAYCHRQDAETQANELRAIEFAQLNIGRAFFPREGYKLETLTPIDGAAGLPTDYGVADVVADASGELDYIAPREFATARAAGTVGRRFSITGASLLVDASIASLEFGFYAKPAELTTDASVSWLSIYYADALVWAAVAEQMRFVQDFDAAEGAWAHAAMMLRNGTDYAKRAEHAGGGLSIRGR
jgi:hypothetical protein